jgi:hypothetical protein
LSRIGKKQVITQIEFFSLSSPKGGEGRGEEVVDFKSQTPHPKPSPRLGGERGKK